MIFHQKFTDFALSRIIVFGIFDEYSTGKFRKFYILHFKPFQFLNQNVRCIRIFSLQVIRLTRRPELTEYSVISARK